MRGEKQMPVVLYFGTGSPGYDYIVDDKESSESIGEYADESDLSYTVYEVPGAIYSQYYKTIDEYMQMFTEASDTTESKIAYEARSVDEPLSDDPFAQESTDDSTN